MAKISKKIFEFETIQETVEQIQKGLQFPYASVQYSTLGGNENVAVIVKASLDSSKVWYNGIIHNSRFSFFHVDSNGTVEQFSKASHVPKFRKCRVKSVEGVVNKINEFVFAD